MLNSRSACMKFLSLSVPFPFLFLFFVRSLFFRRESEVLLRCELRAAFGPRSSVDDSVGSANKE